MSNQVSGDPQRTAGDLPTTLTTEALRWIKHLEDGWKRTSISEIYVTSPSSSQGGGGGASLHLVLVYYLQTESPRATTELNSAERQSLWLSLGINTAIVIF